MRGTIPLRLLALLAVIPCTIAFGREVGNWSVDSSGRWVRYTVHGTNVWGHQFGFMKPSGACEEDIVYLGWSTDDPAIEEYEDQSASITLRMDTTVLEMQIPLLATYSFAGGTLTLMNLSEVQADEQLLSELSQAKGLNVKFLAPEAMLQHLDITEDEFDLTGYRAARKAATGICLNMEFGRG